MTTEISYWPSLTSEMLSRFALTDAVLPYRLEMRMPAYRGASHCMLAFVVIQEELGIAGDGRGVARPSCPPQY